jgi:predicted nucleic acid-binding protein
MPKPRIYVDTTIPSLYHSRRTDPKLVEWRAATHRWWEAAIHACELVTSPAVLRELARGRSDLVPKRLAMIEDLELLLPNEDVDRTAALYVRHKIMPADPEGDALHLALASHYECDVLITWNYHHLANTNKLDRIKKLNAELGLFVPRIRTPLDLMEEDHE